MRLLTLCINGSYLSDDPFMPNLKGLLASRPPGGTSQLQPSHIEQMIGEVCSRVGFVEVSKAAKPRQPTNSERSAAGIGASVTCIPCPTMAQPCNVLDTRVSINSPSTSLLSKLVCKDRGASCPSSLSVAADAVCPGTPGPAHAESPTPCWHGLVHVPPLE